MKRHAFLALLSLACAAAHAAEPRPTETTGCDDIFAGRTPPALVDARLDQRVTILCNDAYASLASGLTRGPFWSAEHLTTNSLTRARGLEREGTFHADERLAPEDRAQLSDYAHSGYDRGHMAPSGDMPDRASQQQSFSLGNVVPQTAALNRAVWEDIERAVRHLAERQGDIYVVTGPLFEGETLAFLHERVLVPTSTWKAVYDPLVRGAAAYNCTNVIQPVCTYLSIAALVRLTSIDPFPSVSDGVKLVAMPLPRPELGHYWPHRWKSRVRSGAVVLAPPLADSATVAVPRQAGAPDIICCPLPSGTTRAPDSLRLSN